MKIVDVRNGIHVMSYAQHSQSDLSFINSFIISAIYFYQMMVMTFLKHAKAKKTKVDDQIRKLTSSISCLACNC